jgi:hypothetical protein
MNNANAQIGGAVISKYPDLKNTAGFNINAGPFLQRDAFFIGFAIDYSRLLSGPWSFSTSIGYDKETDRSKDPEVSTKSWTIMGTINYSIDKFSFATGFGKGFANTSNPSKVMKFSNGDWATGFVVSYALPDLPWSDRDNISTSAAIEYNITSKEWNLSFDLGFGWSF